MNDDAFRRLEPDMFRAPSAHNTQPWTLHYDDPDRVRLGYDPARALPLGDPTQRDLFLSLGCFVETALIVCADAGLPVTFQAAVERSTHTVGHFVTADAPYKSRFGLLHVRGRQTNRLRYVPRREPYDQLQSISDVLPAAVRFDVLRVGEIRDLFLQSDAHLYSTPGVAEELLQWMRLHDAHPDYHRDGLNREMLALSRFEAGWLRFVLHPRNLWLLRRTPLLRLLNALAADVLGRHGWVMILSSTDMDPANDPARLLDLGRGLQRVWLRLGQLGFYTHPLSQIIDDPATHAALRERLGLSGAQVFSLFRVGHADAPAQSPRLVSSEGKA